MRRRHRLWFWCARRFGPLGVERWRPQVASERMAGRWVYVVTDIEVDGPWYGANSMRSFASVARTDDGRELGTFEAVLEPLPGAVPNPHTLVWFQTEPAAWAAATVDPKPAAAVM